MPDKKKKEKKTKWLSMQFWFRLFYEGVGEENADTVLARLASLREMIEEGKAGRHTASKAIQRAMRACGRLTTAQVLAERAEYDAKKRKKHKEQRRTSGRQ